MNKRLEGFAEEMQFVPKVFLNEYGFRVTEVRVLANANLPVWECKDEYLISKSSKEEVEMTVAAGDQLPKKLFSYELFAREFKMVSLKPIKRLSIEQLVYFNDNIVESMKYRLGYAQLSSFVMPRSINAWQSVVQVDAKVEPSALSGRVVVETKFFDEEKVIFISRIRVHYK